MAHLWGYPVAKKQGIPRNWPFGFPQFIVTGDALCNGLQGGEAVTTRPNRLVGTGLSLLNAFVWCQAVTANCRNCKGDSQPELELQELQRLAPGLFMLLDYTCLLAQKSPFVSEPDNLTHHLCITRFVMMKIAVRCIYYKAVNPSCDIVDLPDSVWREFLHSGNEKRRAMACAMTNQKEEYVREVAWIPLDGQDKLAEISLY